nr:hypothetical protein [Candidatus Brocadiales bacterium]
GIMSEVRININAQTTGDQSIQNQIDNLRNISKASEEATEQQKLLNEATELYGDNLQKTNRYVMEGLRISRDRALQGARERVAETEAKVKRAPHDFSLQHQLDRRKAEYDKVRTEYADEMMAERERVFGGRGAPTDDTGGAGVDMASMLTQAGITRGMGGMAQVGVGRFVRSGMGRMAGMSTMGKIGMGAAVGGAAYLGYKAIQWAGEGMDLNKRFFQDMLPFRAAMKDMGGDVDKMNSRMERMSLNIGESVFNTIALSKEWMKIGGGDVFGDKQAMAMDTTVKMAKMYGLDPNLAISYTGQMARYGGYTGTQDRMNNESLQRVLANAEIAGMSGMRRSEYVNQVLSVTQAIGRTAGTVNPEIANYLGNFASMGEPFRGERGASLFARLNAGIVSGGQSGIGLLAAKNVVASRGEGGDIYDWEMQKLEGLNDPEMLKEYWRIAKRMTGGDKRRAGLLLSRELGMPDQLKMLYNDDKEINSVFEKMDAGQFVEAQEDWKKTKSAYEDDLGWRSKIGSIASEIIKLNTMESAFAMKVGAIDANLSRLANHIVGNYESEPSVNVDRFREWQKSRVEAKTQYYGNEASTVHGGGRIDTLLPGEDLGLLPPNPFQGRSN